jgi:NADH-quinone oxidoreductase subunit J
MEPHAVVALVPGATGDTAEIVMFWVFAVMALGAGIAVITMRNIVHGALMLVVNLLAVAGLYVTLESPFLGIIQVLVYGGAIMVLFLFVIMLLGVHRDDLLLATGVQTRVLAVVGSALLAGALLFGFVGPYTSDMSVCGQPGLTGLGTSQAVVCQGLEQAVQDHEGGSVGLLGERLFTRYTFPFELAALLLTVATIGATVLGRRRDLVAEDPLPVGAGPLDGADGIRVDRPHEDVVSAVGSDPGAPQGVVEGSERPADHDLPARPDRDREV